MSTTALIHIVDNNSYYGTLVKCHDGYEIGMVNALNKALIQNNGRLDSNIIRTLLTDDDFGMGTKDIHYGEEFIYTIDLSNTSITVDKVYFSETTETTEAYKIFKGNIYEYINKMIQPFNSDLVELCEHHYSYYLNNISKHETELTKMFIKLNKWNNGSNLLVQLNKLQESINTYKDYVQRMSNDNPNVRVAAEDIAKTMKLINKMNVREDVINA